jgi:hypothetical protein
MAFSQTIVQRVAVASLFALGLAACGGDNGPTEFDATGTTADVQAVDQAFASPAVAGFAAVGANMDAALGSPVVSASFGAIGQGRSPRTANAAGYVASVRGLLAARGTARGAAVAGGPARIPAELEGMTFVYDPTAGEYVESELTGAPSNGVRFVLYAVDPLTGEIAEGLTEVGHADLIDESTESEVSARVLVVSTSDVTHLDYRVTASGNDNGGNVNVDGFVTDGTTRADFDLENRITGDENSATLTLDYSLDVPSRDLAMTNTAVMAISEQAVTISYDASFRGPNGDVDLDGELDLSGGEFTVRVDGDVFATLTVDGEAGSITVLGADGEPLDAAEREALENVFEFADDVSEVFTDLLAPVLVLLGAVSI